MRLEARALSFGYPERPVGRDATITVEPGEILCLLGPNGCGKTTLFKTLLGLLPAQGGEVRIGGALLSGLKRPDIARRIGYVPQAQGVAFPYTALDLVLMGRVAHRGVFSGPTTDDRERALGALSALGITDLGQRDVTTLSGGQRQLVMIARAVAQAAPLIVMDEPTASLDFGNQVVVLRQIKRLAESGTGVILSTHDPDHAFAIADRVILMRDGQQIAGGKPTAVLDDENLLAVYGVAVSVEHLANARTVCVPHY